MTKKKKKIIGLIVALVLIVAVAAGALAIYLIESKHKFVLDESGEGYIFERIGSFQSNVEVPAEYEGKPVIAIGDKAFADSGLVRSVVLPDTIRSIGEQAFFQCRKLESVTVSSSVTFIGARAFWECDSLQTIAIPDLGAWLRIEFDGDVFSLTPWRLSVGGTTLTNLEIPGGTEKINSYAFCGCQGLTSLKLNEGLTEIGDGAFAGCNFETLTFPSTLKKIGDAAFSDCTVKELTFPKGLEEIGRNAFYDSEVSTLDFPEGLKTIGQDAFGNGQNLTEVHIPASVTSIGRGAFNTAPDNYAVVTFDGTREEFGKIYQKGNIFGKGWWKVVCIDGDYFQ